MDNEKATEVTSLVMVANTLDPGRTDGTVATELARGRMDDAIRVNGAMAWLMERAEKLMLMEPFGTMDSGSMTNPFDRNIFLRRKWFKTVGCTNC